MDLNASLTQIFDFGGNVASVRRRTQACDFANRVIFCSAGYSRPILGRAGCPGGRASRLVPVSDSGESNAFKDILLLWSGSRLKWSDSNNSSSWVPVAATATTFTFATLAAFTQLAPGVESDIIPVNTSPLGLVAGQFCSSTRWGHFVFSSCPGTSGGRLTANLASFCRQCRPASRRIFFSWPGCSFRQESAFISMEAPGTWR